VLTLVLTAALAAVGLRLAGARRSLTAVLLVTGILLLSRPGQWNLLQGQVTVPMVLAAYAALVLPRRRALLAGCALALCLVKPNFGLPLAAIMLVRGQVLPVVCGGALMLALNLPLVALLAERAGGLRSLAEHVGGAQANLSRTAELHSQFNVFRIDGVALVSRLSPVPPGALGSVLIGGLVMLVTAIALRMGPHRGRPAATAETVPTWAESGLICSAILLCGYHIGYDLLLLTWPAVALGTRIATHPRSTPVREWLALGLIAVLAGNYLTSFAVIEALRDRLGMPPALSVVLTSLNSLALLSLFAVYLVEMAKARPSALSDLASPTAPEPTGGPLVGVPEPR
jgi:hypothetical protein